MSAHAVNTADVMQVVVFRVDTQEFGLDILQVERILRYERPAALPQAPDFLEGVVRYDGAAVPVVDLRKRLEVDATVREETRLMVVLIDEQRVGVLVDEVREVLRVDSTTITAPPPMVRGLAATYIAGILARQDRTVVILNASRLLTSTERVALHGVGT
jgi:purine-binding chemotaxis protein CheW